MVKRLLISSVLLLLNLIIISQCVRPPIIGGHPTQPHAYPFMCSLELLRSTETVHRHFCGTTILSEQWLLSAAHCVQATNDMNNFRVKCGKWDLSVTESMEQVRNVSSVVWHELFEATTEIGFDIALVKLDAPLTWTNEVQPMRLVTPDEVLNIESSTIIGWGAIQVEPALFPYTLQEASVAITPFDECTAIFDAVLGNVFNVTLHEDVICAGTFGSDISACGNDSGSPLLQKTDEGEWIQVGVASWTLFDCSPPAGYIKVASFLRLDYSPLDLMSGIVRFR